MRVVLAPRLGRGAGAHRRVAAAGLAFMTFHFPDEVDTNLLTIDATDPQVAAPPSSRPRAIRVEKHRVAAQQASAPRPSRRRSRETDGHPACSTPAPTAPSAPRSTRCSARRRRGWEGGARGAGRDGPRRARRRHEARARRHLLLPGLHAVQERVGWISAGALNYICERLTVPPAEAYGVATFYALLATRAAAAARGPRLRRHRLPLRRLARS